MLSDRLTRAQRRKLENEAHIKLDLDNLANIDIQHLEDDLASPSNAEAKSALSGDEKSQEPQNGNDKAKLDKEMDVDTSDFDIGGESDLSSALESDSETERHHNKSTTAPTNKIYINTLKNNNKNTNNNKIISNNNNNKTEPADANSDSSSSSDSDDSEDSDDSDDSDREASDESEEEEDEDLEQLLLKAQKALSVQHNDMIGLEKSAKPTYSLPKLNPGLSVQDELYIKPTNKKAAKLIDSAIELVSSDEKKPSNKKATLTVVANKDQEKKVSRKERQAEREKTAGKGWFDMGKTEITPEVKRDLQVLKMRHVLDRKRHYKKMGNKSDPKYFQIGTIIESPTEFFSARMTKKERKQNIVDELMANDDQRQYYKRKFNEVQERTNSGGKKHYKKLKAKKEWAK